MTFGQLIKAAREAQGLSHYDVIEAAGLGSRQYLQTLEKDKAGPSLDTARRLAVALSLDPAAVMATKRA